MADLVTSESRRYLHGIQKETNDTTELPYTVPVDNQVTYIDSFTNYGVDTVYGKEYVIAASSGRADASGITNTPTGNIAATTVQAAINELDSEKGGLSTNNSWAGTQSFTNATDATSVGTGSVVLSGGMSLAKQFWCAGNFTVEQNVSANSSVRVINLNGGATAAAQFIFINDSSRNLRIQKTSSGFSGSPLTGGPFGEQAAIFTDSNHPICIGVNVTAVLCLSLSAVNIYPNTASTSTTSGALVVSGGVGCGDYFTGKYRSSDGTAGLTATRTFYAASSSGGAVNVLNTVTIKDGIITAWTQA